MEKDLYQNGHEASALPTSTLSTTNNVDDDGLPKRSGTLWTATAHIVTVVIGSGVLSLAWSMAKLGWVGGPIVLVIFALITYYTSLLLADCYRSNSPDGSTPGKRNRTYMEAVQSNLGQVHTKLCMLSQYTTLFGITIGYTITSSISMMAIKRANCFHKYGHKANCFASPYTYMTIFGVVEVVLSQIPNFGNLWWLSIIAATMSFSYSFIGIGLGIGKALESGDSHGAISGSIYSNGHIFAHKTSNVWQVLQALGNIAFAYSYTALLVEIQVFCQPIYALVEDTIASYFPKGQIVLKLYKIPLPFSSFNRKKWEPWTESLRKVALHPEQHANTVLQVTQEAVVIIDKFPKGRKHLLVVARQDGLDSLLGLIMAESS